MVSREDSATERVVLPLAEERAEIGVRPVTRERVLIRKTVETREEIVERALLEERLLVERVPIGREIETAPEMREEDGVLVVPVVEEELVVRTRLVLKEELRIGRRQVQRTVREPVRLRREVAEVERLGPEESATPEGGQQDHGNHE